ncbi:MAG: lysozyme [Acidobacteriaceae bacterium]
MDASQACIDIVAYFEGFSANKYNDAAGHCTIGYGTLLHRGNCDGTEGYAEGISEPDAKALLASSLCRVAQEVTEIVKLPLKQCQFDALCAFAYNLGCHALVESTLLLAINSGTFADVPDQFRRWDFAAGVELAGLKRRRVAEAAMWSSG